MRVAAPPERGKANAAVERLVAELVGIPRGQVAITAGYTSVRKTLELTGVSEEEVRRRLGIGAV